MDAFTYVLGDFTSIGATLKTHYPTAILVDSSGKPTGNTAANHAPDHIAFTGTLKSGALASVVMRGQSTVPGRVHLRWDIDGEDGVIQITSDEGKSSDNQLLFL